MTSQEMTSSNYGIRPKIDIVKPKMRGNVTNQDGTEPSGVQFPASEAEADCEGSSGSYNRQDEQGELQSKRSFTQAFGATSGINGDDVSHINIQLGHPEGCNSLPPNASLPVGTSIPKSNLNFGMEYWNGPGAAVIAQDTSGVCVPVPLPHAASGAPANMTYRAPVSVDYWQPQDEKELKRQKRKEANRESARRSRMRKQAECDELSERVQALTAENQSLRVEVDRLNEICQKLTSENAMLIDRLGK